MAFFQAKLCQHGCLQAGIQCRRGKRWKLQSRSFNVVDNFIIKHKKGDLTVVSKDNSNDDDYGYELGCVNMYILLKSANLIQSALQEAYHILLWTNQ